MANLNLTPCATSILRIRMLELCLILPFASLVGCGSGNQRLQQLQNENDRLLSEFRAQRDQATQLSERLAEVQSRLAESEKLLASQSPMPSGRLSRLNNGLGSATPSTPLSVGASKDRNLGASNGSGISSSGTATAPATSKNATTTPELYWRPMRRETP